MVGNRAKAAGISCTRGIFVSCFGIADCLFGGFSQLGARGLTENFSMWGFLFGWMHMFCFLKSQPTKKAMKSQLDTLKVFMKLVADFQDLLRRSQHGLSFSFRSKKCLQTSCIGLSPSNDRIDQLQVFSTPTRSFPIAPWTIHHGHTVYGAKKNPRWLAIRLDVGFPQVQARVSDTKWVNCTGHHVALTWAKAPPSNPDWPMEQTFTFSFSIPINLNHVCTDPSRICVAFGQSGWVASSGTSPDPKDQVSFCVGAWSQLTV